MTFFIMARKIKGHNNYTPLQKDIIAKGRSSEFPDYGNVDDLDPKKFNSYQMRAISLGRGNNPKYGNIDDLDPKEHSHTKMVVMIESRGNGVRLF